MKICIVSGFAIETIAPLHPSYSGLEWVAGVLGMELSNMGYDVTIICSKGSRVPNVRLITPIEADWSFDAEEEAYRQYRKELESFDVIIDSSHWKLAKDEAHIQVWHDWLAESEPWDGKKDAVHVSPSYAHAIHMSSLLLEEVRTIHHGIPVDLYPFNRDREDFLLYLGRVTPYKNPLSAIEYAKKTGNKLAIAGEDYNVESRAYVFDVMKACVENGFEYLGRVSLAKKLELLSRAKALILPYQYPYYRCVFELSLIEANVCGAPVIISDCQSAEREIITNGLNGFVCGSEDEFLSAIKRVDEIDPKECRRLVESRFSSKRMAEDYASLIASL